MIIKLQKARKDHWCSDCGRKIPKGHRYWRDHDPESTDPDAKTHTNCLLYETQPHKEDEQ